MVDTPSVVGDAGPTHHADLRIVAPRDFFTVRGERIETTAADRNRRPRDSRLPLPGTLLSRKWKGRTILVEVLPRTPDMISDVLSRHFSLAQGTGGQGGWCVAVGESG